MTEKRTDIHKPNGFWGQGAKIGHVDEQSRIRERDGLIFRGEQLGYVDEKNKVRRPDGFILKGDVVGQIKKGNKAADEDGIIFPGEEWGYVDRDGNIRQRDGAIFKGRIIGKMRGANKAAALGFYVLRFKQMEDRFKELERMVESASNKTPFLGKVQRMLSYVPNADALGDFDALLNRMRNTEREILAQFDENRRNKQELVREAEALSSSDNWKQAAESLRALQEKWKSIRSAGRDHEQELWRRFRAAQDRFYKRRTEYFQKKEHERKENLKRKEQVCSAAQSLSQASDHRSAVARIKELQAEWKAIGPVPKEQQEALWNRFRRACDQVFENSRKERERKAAEWEKRNREWADNLQRKERLCSIAESFAGSGDSRSAVDKIKELQAEWKSIGPVPKDRANALWERFRRACDHVFQNAREERERKQQEWQQRVQERERRQAEWRNKMTETLERKREQADRLRDSIAHDEANIDRWQDTIYNLRDGGRADEIRDSLESRIADVESKISSKQDRVADLEQAIREIERKLYG